MKNNTRFLVFLFSLWLGIIMLVIVLALATNDLNACRNQLANCEELYSKVVDVENQKTENLPRIVR